MVTAVATGVLVCSTFQAGLPGVQQLGVLCTLQLRPVQCRGTFHVDTFPSGLPALILSESGPAN